MCLICYKRLNNDSNLSSLFLKEAIICSDCLKKFKIINKKDRFYQVDITYLYEYNDFFKGLLYKFKGCYDIALKDVFLYKYKNYIKLHYFNYVIIYPPSSEIDNKNRGFKHIEKIVECLHMKSIDMFYKVTTYKQSDQSFHNRPNIENIIKVKESIKIENIKYLIVDDIFTSGSTIKTIIKLLVKHKVDKENIKVLILAKTNKSD